jgi:hypothetical protein
LDSKTGNHYNKWHITFKMQNRMKSFSNIREGRSFQKLQHSNPFITQNNFSLDLTATRLRFDIKEHGQLQSGSHKKSQQGSLELKMMYAS